MRQILYSPYLDLNFQSGLWKNECEINQELFRWDYEYKFQSCNAYINVIKKAGDIWDSRIIPQIICANLVQLRASADGNYAKYRASHPDKPAKTFRVAPVRRELKLSGRCLMVDRSAVEMHPISSLLRNENGDRRSCAISTTLRRAGEKAVDVIEEIQQLPAEVSAAAVVVREVRIISLNEIFPLVPFNFHNSFTDRSRRRRPEKVRGCLSF